MQVLVGAALAAARLEFGQVSPLHIINIQLCNRHEGGNLGMP